MQNLSKSDLAALIVGLHRAKQKGLPVALVGAGLPMLPALVGEAKSYAERGFEFRGIGALDREAAEDALAEPAQERGVRWQQMALDRIIGLTQGYPYFLQRPQELTVLRDRLVKASLLFAPRRGTVDFTVPLCADYIRRALPERL